MNVTMVKKRLASGEACGKCEQAEALLKKRGLFDRIDTVVIADEGNPESPGMVLGARHGIKLAPFFIVRNDDGTETAYESVLKLIKDRLGDQPAEGFTPVDRLTEEPSRVTVTTGMPVLTPMEIEVANGELAARHPRDILRWGLERYGNALGIAFSGAEDVVLIHLASELGLPYSVFCLDTGRLHPETYRFLETVRKQYGCEIELMNADAPVLEAFVKKKGLFSFYEDGHGECCGIRKIEPMRRKLGTLQAWATGQRRDQSPATRGAIAAVELDRTFSGVNGALTKLNPLAAWSSAQVWQFIREHHVPFNVLHERGFVSIGCEPCTRPPLPGEHERAGRWWWEDATKRECGLHIGNTVPGT